MKQYKPNMTMMVWPCPGLEQMVASARTNGIQVAVDFGGDGDVGDFEEVNSSTVLSAVHEMDESRLVLIDVCGRVRGTILVIPENGGDWLSDYTANEFTEAVVRGAEV